MYTQYNLPNFDQAYADANQLGLDRTGAVAKQYIHYAKMERKCQNPKTLLLIRHQRERMVRFLGRVRLNQR